MGVMPIQPFDKLRANGLCVVSAKRMSLVRIVYKHTLCVANSVMSLRCKDK
jgi:hypothetical protein